MGLLRTITSGMPKSLMDLLNEAIVRVNAFGKMTGDGRVVVTWSHGVPSLAIRDSDPPGILFYNDQAEDIPAYAYMPVTGYDTTNKILKVGKPSTTFYQSYLINGARVVPYQTTGRAQDSLEQRLLYNTGTPAVGEGYGPTPGQWYATKNYPQASVCQGIHDSSAKIMLATLGVIDRVIGKPNAAINKGATNGVVNVYSGVSGSETIITSMQISNVYNRGNDVGTGDFVEVHWVDGQPVIDGSLCASSPASVTTLGAGSEGSETAASDTWTACGSTGLDDWRVTRVVYNDAGDEKLYAMMRKYTYDKTGKLYLVSAETRVTVDIPEDC